MENAKNKQASYSIKTQVMPNGKKKRCRTRDRGKLHKKL